MSTPTEPTKTYAGIRIESAPAARLHLHRSDPASGAADTRPGAVLVVDDETAPADALAQALRGAGHDAETVSGGEAALARLAERRFDAMVTDIHMPRLRGDVLLRLARECDPDLAVLLSADPDTARRASQCLREGAFDVLAKPFDLDDALARVDRALEHRRLVLENRGHRHSLEARVAEQAEGMARTLQGSLEALITALEAKDRHTRNHSARVAEMSSLLAQSLAPDDLPFLRRVRVAALFHDIGKIGVPEYILHKTSPLSPEEMREVERHVLCGVTILSPLLDPETVAMVRHHHERIDGRGYPDAIGGDAIPLGARIVAVADAWDAMTSSRPYRPAMPRDRVWGILRAGAGIQWDAQVVDAFLARALPQPQRLAA